VRFEGVCAHCPFRRSAAAGDLEGVSACSGNSWGWLRVDTMMDDCGCE
jgi:hypothetical protein